MGRGGLEAGCAGIGVLKSSRASGTTQHSALLSRPLYPSPEASDAVVLC